MRSFKGIEILRQISLTKLIRLIRLTPEVQTMKGFVASVFLLVIPFVCLSIHFSAFASKFGVHSF